MKKKWFCKLKRTVRFNKRTLALLGLTVDVARCGRRIRAGQSAVWVRSAADIDLPNYPSATEAVLLLHEQATTVSDSGEVTTPYRRACRILRPEGRSFGTVSVAYDSETRINLAEGLVHSAKWQG